MTYNRKVMAKRGETGFCFHTPFYDEDGAILDLSAIDVPSCTFTFTVSDTAGTVIISGEMELHPDQTKHPNHMAYFGTPTDMAKPAGTYNWEIEFTDASGNITKYPKDDGNDYGTFTLRPSLA